MKALKLEHRYAQLVLSGQVQSTFRLYDDKDLTVNDEIQLIDQVDRDKPATWQPIGVGIIDQILEKKIADITNEEIVQMIHTQSRQELLNAIHRFYGGQIDETVPVKLIRFKFVPGNTVPGLFIQGKVTEVDLYADGGSRGNPGNSASGYVLLDKTGNILVRKGVFLGVTTNNQAEYQALKWGLEEAHAIGARKVHVYMDSLLVVNQMIGVYKVRNRDLWPVHSLIQEYIAAHFESVTFVHVPRELNKLADQAVNDTLDAAETKT
jgi:ribonuclease HI